jgi:superfamily II DNA or RNA helicase
MENPSRNQLRAWQVEAIGAWQKNWRGIVVAATGTGKTRVGIEVAKESLARGHKVLIVAPTIALMEQWLSVVRTSNLTNPKLIGSMGGGATGFRPEQNLVVAVLDSAKQRGRSLLDIWHEKGLKVTVIFDECHNLSAGECVGLLNAGFDFTLGLSATPASESGSFSDFLHHAIGPTVYELPLKRALDEGLIGPLRALDLLFPLKSAELEVHRIQSARINQSISHLRQGHPEVDFDSDLVAGLQGLSTANPQAAKILELLSESGRLVSGSRARLETLGPIMESGIFQGRQSIIFNQNVQQAEDATRILRERGFDVALDHSRIAPRMRQDALRRFRSGAVTCLVAVRTMDEGIDVPEAELAIILSGSLVKRQRIQRIGRILRPRTPGLVISLFAKGTLEELLVAKDDPGLLGEDRVAVFDLDEIEEGVRWLIS